MKIVIYGTGGVGGYFGARLHQAGKEVIFIARGKHLKAIQQNGLQLTSYLGNYTAHPVIAKKEITSIKNIDLILICVKAWQLEEVATKIISVISKNTIVIPLLNGVTIIDTLISTVDKKHLFGGLCKVVSRIEDYGKIVHDSYQPTIVFGELDHQKTERSKRIEKLFKKASITTILSEDIQKDTWIKFIYITTVSAIGALTRFTIGEMCASKEIKEMMVQTAEVIVSIATAKGIKLPPDIIKKQFKIIESQPFNTTSSLQRDMMAGKPSELEYLNGAVVKLGLELGIATPINSFIYKCLLPQEKRARLKQ